jgi:hypothetical protein
LGSEVLMGASENYRGPAKPLRRQVPRRQQLRLLLPGNKGW